MPTQRAPRPVGMLEHLDSTHPGSMSILSTASLLAVEALLPLCVLKQGLKTLGFDSKSWGLAGVLRRSSADWPQSRVARHHSGKIEPVTVDMFS